MSALPQSVCSKPSTTSSRHRHPASHIDIGEDRVRLNTPGGERVLANARVYIFAGGVLPTALLSGVGIQLERHFGKGIEVLEPASA